MNKHAWLMKTVPLIFILGFVNGFTQSTVEKVFRANNYDIEFTFPGNWRLSDVNHPYDLQCTNGSCYVSVFGFSREDLDEPMML